MVFQDMIEEEAQIHYMNKRYQRLLNRGYTEWTDEEKNHLRYELLFLLDMKQQGDRGLDELQEYQDQSENRWQCFETYQEAEHGRTMEEFLNQA